MDNNITQEDQSVVRQKNQKLQSFRNSLRLSITTDQSDEDEDTPNNNNKNSNNDKKLQKQNKSIFASQKTQTNNNSINDVNNISNENIQSPQQSNQSTPLSSQNDNLNRRFSYIQLSDKIFKGIQGDQQYSNFLTERDLLKLQRIILLKSDSVRTEKEVDILKHSLKDVKFLHRIQKDYGQDKLLNIIKKLSYETFEKGETLFKKGDRGDKFYIILRGEVVVFKPYFKNIQEDFDEEKENKQHILKEFHNFHKDLELAIKQNPHQNNQNQLNQDQYNKRQQYLQMLKSEYVVQILGNGMSFGEVALIHRQQKRTATIIATQHTECAILEKKFYLEVVEALQEIEQSDRQTFLLESHYFTQKTFKELVIISHLIQHEKLETKRYIYKEGDITDGIVYFVFKGEFQLIKQIERESLSDEQKLNQNKNLIKRNNSYYFKVSVLEPGQLFGIESFLGIQKRLYSVVPTFSDSELFQASISDLNEYMFTSQNQRKQFIQMLQEQLKHQQERVEKTYKELYSPIQVQTIDGYEIKKSLKTRQENNINKQIMQKPVKHFKIDQQISNKIKDNFENKQKKLLNKENIYVMLQKDFSYNTPTSQQQNNKFNFDSKDLKNQQKQSIQLQKQSSMLSQDSFQPVQQVKLQHFDSIVNIKNIARKMVKQQIQRKQKKNKNEQFDTKSSLISQQLLQFYSERNTPLKKPSIDINRNINQAQKNCDFTKSDNLQFFQQCQVSQNLNNNINIQDFSQQKEIQEEQLQLQQQNNNNINNPEENNETIKNKSDQKPQNGIYITEDIQQQNSKNYQNLIQQSDINQKSKNSPNTSQFDLDNSEYKEKLSPKKVVPNSEKIQQQQPSYQNSSQKINTHRHLKSRKNIQDKITSQTTVKNYNNSSLISTAFSSHSLHFQQQQQPIQQSNRQFYSNNKLYNSVQNISQLNRIMEKDQLEQSRLQESLEKSKHSFFISQDFVKKFNENQQDSEFCTNRTNNNKNSLFRKSSYAPPKNKRKTFEQIYREINNSQDDLGEYYDELIHTDKQIKFKRNPKIQEQSQQQQAQNFSSLSQQEQQKLYINPMHHNIIDENPNKIIENNQIYTSIPVSGIFSILNGNNEKKISSNTRISFFSKFNKNHKKKAFKQKSISSRTTQLNELFSEIKVKYQDKNQQQQQNNSTSTKNGQTPQNGKLDTFQLLIHEEDKQQQKELQEELDKIKSVQTNTKISEDDAMQTILNKRDRKITQKRLYSTERSTIQQDMNQVKIQNVQFQNANYPIHKLKNEIIKECEEIKNIKSISTSPQNQNLKKQNELYDKLRKQKETNFSEYSSYYSLIQKNIIEQNQLKKDALKKFLKNKEQNQVIEQKQKDQLKKILFTAESQPQPVQKAKLQSSKMIQQKGSAIHLLSSNSTQDQNNDYQNSQETEEDMYNFKNKKKPKNNSIKYDDQSPQSSTLNHSFNNQFISSQFLIKNNQNNSQSERTLQLNQLNTYRQDINPQQQLNSQQRAQTSLKQKRNIIQLQQQSQYWSGTPSKFFIENQQQQTNDNTNISCKEDNNCLNNSHTSIQIQQQQQKKQKQKPKVQIQKKSQRNSLGIYSTCDNSTMQCNNTTTSNSELQSKTHLTRQQRLQKQQNKQSYIQQLQHIHKAQEYRNIRDSLIQGQIQEKLKKNSLGINKQNHYHVSQQFSQYSRSKELNIQITQSSEQ